MGNSETKRLLLALCCVQSVRCIPIVFAYTLYQQKEAVLLPAICDQVWRSGRDLVGLADSERSHRRRFAGRDRKQPLKHEIMV